MASAAPEILKYTGDRPRPLLSVVIPTYEPTRFLVDALQSVLCQDLGAERMQILISDDASPSVDVARFVAEADPHGRVELYKNDRNLGLAGNWNAGIARAQGEIIHILHQDDCIERSFYESVLPGFQAGAAIGMAFSRHAYIDESGRVTHRSHKERWRAGVLKNWLRLITEKQRIQCAAVLVRRQVYEQLGGYRSDLCFALDWEMWVRIAVHFSVWYEPTLLAHYRQHSRNESHRLRDAGQADADILKTIETFGTYLSEPAKDDLLSNAYANFARRALKQLESMEVARDTKRAKIEALDVAISRMTTLPRIQARYLAKRDTAVKRLGISTAPAK